MEVFRFLGLNIGIVGLLALAVFIYLVVLINKRRGSKFLHENEKDRERS
ncbi:MAG TPA: hypothetical protein VGR15_00675 [Bacteroidota bacterium]|jgi:hypothetical protein|nr:hypothetical protein [Bacteroidota bacterium]